MHVCVVIFIQFSASYLILKIFPSPASSTDISTMGGGFGSWRWVSWLNVIRFWVLRLVLWRWLLERVRFLFVLHIVIMLCFFVFLRVIFMGIILGFNLSMHSVSVDIRLVSAPNFMTWLLINLPAVLLPLAYHMSSHDTLTLKKIVTHSRQ